MNRTENKIDFFQKVERIQPTIYYHYTSLDALFHIVNSRTFRLTSLRSSNDRQELFYNVNRFITDFSSVCENEADVNTKHCFQRLLKSIEDNRPSFEKECKARHTPYALCLSKKRDNLTHWDRYAVNCTGVCIGLNINALYILYRRTNNYIFGMGLFDAAETLYTQEAINQHIRNKTIEYLNVLIKATEEEPQITPLDIIDKGGFVYMLAVYQNVMKFAKNGSFIDEDEIRLYHEAESVADTLKMIKSTEDDLEKPAGIDYESAFNELVDKLKIREENFMMTKNGIRSFRNLCLNEIWGSGVIPEIILGPMCVQNRKELERFLRCNGLGDTKISVSKVPLR